MKIRNRVTGLEYVRAGDLKPHPKNHRLHPRAQMAALKGVMGEVGFAGAILAIKTADGYVIVDGHARAGLDPDQIVPVLVLDLDEKEAEKVLLTYDAIGKMAAEDEERLAALIREFETENDELRELVAGLMPPLEPAPGNTDPDEVPEPPAEPTVRRGEIWKLGDHRLMCGDAGSVEDLDRLLDGAPVHLVCADPPYGVKVEPRSNNAIAAGLSSFTNAKGARRGGGLKHHQGLDLARHPGKARATGRMRAKDRPLQNDFLPEEDFAKLLLAWFGNLARVLLPGHAFYLWGGYANVANYPPALKANGLYFSQSIIWVKGWPVLTRKDFMGNHEWCQPPGTRVLTPDGDVPIESLRDGDRVISFSRRSSAVVGFRRGFGVRVASRAYEGDLLGVTVGSRTTWCTDGHIWSVRLVPDANRIWCTYLMRRGAWWRVGKCRLHTTWGFGLKHRLKSERADEAWVLGIHESNLDALGAETETAARYGIPTVYWDPTPGRTWDVIRRIYDRLDPEAQRAAAHRALADHGRRVEYPFVERGKTRTKVGARAAILMRACNLLPKAMVVPVPTDGVRGNFAWEAIDRVEMQAYGGPVHSMEVEKHGHYVADGIVTHNCFYGWKEGAAHRFFGPANIPDTWDVRKISPQKMNHLTEKPTELSVRAIEYSSLRGENVLDLFGGSGSCLIAAEQTGRRCFMLELDELYASTIVERWERFTGKKAERRA